MNNGTAKGQHVMIAPGFSMVSEDGTFGLADLRVGGYTASTSSVNAQGKTVWKGGLTTGNFELKIRKKDGTTDRSYFYVDCKKGIEGTTFEEYPAGWYTKSGTKYYPVDPEVLAKETFPQGQAFWVKSAVEGLTLQSAGAVPENDIEFGTIQGSHVAAGNGMPVAYNLGDLSVTGYDPSTSSVNAQGKTVWKGGLTTGNFELKFLKKDGTTDKSYFFVDCKKGIEGSTYEEYPAGWYTKDGTKYYQISAEDLVKIDVPAGQGFWIKRGGTVNLKLVVPAPEL